MLRVRATVYLVILELGRAPKQGKYHDSPSVLPVWEPLDPLQFLQKPKSFSMFSTMTSQMASRTFKLEPRWPTDPPTWPSLAPTWLQLGPPWLHLGPSWHHFGDNLAPSWSQVGPKFVILQFKLPLICNFDNMQKTLKKNSVFFFMFFDVSSLQDGPT